VQFKDPTTFFLLFHSFIFPIRFILFCLRFYDFAKSLALVVLLVVEKRFIRSWAYFWGFFFFYKSCNSRAQVFFLSQEELLNTLPKQLEADTSDIEAHSLIRSYKIFS
jgi:hypothetical protein